MDSIRHNFWSVFRVKPGSNCGQKTMLGATAAFKFSAHDDGKCSCDFVEQIFLIAGQNFSFFLFTADGSESRFVGLVMNDFHGSLVLGFAQLIGRY